MARIHIAVGVIFNDTRDQVLLARRLAHDSHGGLWEFPGGKIESGEGVELALHRELDEELNLKVIKAAPLFLLDYDYPKVGVTLDIWSIEKWSGEVHGREGQEIEWVRISDLWQREFPPANTAIVRWLNLPPLYVITPDLPEYGQPFLLRLETLLRAGMKLLQFRSNLLSTPDRRAVIHEIAALCSVHGAGLLVNGSPDESAGGTEWGLHLNSARLAQFSERQPDWPRLLAASVHNVAELEQAARLDVDFIVIGPVAATRTHAGTTPMGWDSFAMIARRAGRPVYALGGMLPADMGRARQHGARGVAMIRGIWEAGDPAAAIRQCLAR